MSTATTTGTDGTGQSDSWQGLCVGQQATALWIGSSPYRLDTARGLGAAVSANGTAVWAQPISPGYGERGGSGPLCVASLKSY
jgi:hypothetical protein